MIYLYLLKQDDQIKYVGLTIDPEKRKNSHRSRKPKHDFVVVEEYKDVDVATTRERELIEEYSTMRPKGWNISPGGEYKTASGYCRKGIGGAKKGRIPWNKGKTGCFGEETIQRMKKVRKGIAHSDKFSHLIPEIMKRFNSHPPIDGVGKNGSNGRLLTQERAFAKLYAAEYGMTPAHLWNILTGKAWKHTKKPTDMK